jgi:hypothetical protein
LIRWINSSDERPKRKRRAELAQPFALMHIAAMNLSGLFRAAASAALLCASPAWAQNALEEPVSGPMLICFKYSTFALAKDERITHFTGGMESMSIRVQSPAGAYDIGESEIFATPRLGPLIYDHDRTRVFRVRSNTGEYAIAGPTAFDGDRDNIILRLEGDAFTGGAGDKRIYRRFTVRDPGGLDCGWTFTYSWNVFLPSE